MSNILLTAPQFYKEGVSGVSAVVGYESHANRVVRYTFVTPAAGASTVHLAFSGNSKGNGTTPALGFYIGTDPDSHANAGADAPCTGQLSLQADGRSYSGGGEIILLPQTQYYLWVFPVTTVFGWMSWSRTEGNAVAALSGGAGSVLTVGGGVLGQPMTLQITRHGEFSHRITCEFARQVVEVTPETTATTLTWTPPLTLAEGIPNAVAAQAAYLVETISAGAILSAVRYSGQLSVPEEVLPKVSLSWQDTAAHSAWFPHLVQLHSRLAVETAAQGALGSTIRATTVTLGGKAYSGQTLTEQGLLELAVTVTDSRGRTAQQTQLLEVLAYSPPSLQLRASRCDHDGSPNDMGEYALLTATGTYTPLDTPHSPQLTLDGTAYPFSGSFQKVVPAPSTESLRFAASLTDPMLSVAQAQCQLSIGYATLDLLKGGKGIAFGTTATEEGFVCAMDAKFLGKVVFDGLYPVGSLYLSVLPTDPATLFGGVWEPIRDRFLLAAGEISAGSEGGEREHTLTIDELPAHTHDVQGGASNGSKPGLQSYGAYFGTFRTLEAAAQTTGGGLSHNNMPPYLAVYIWKRTA